MVDKGSLATIVATRRSRSSAAFASPARSPGGCGLVVHVLSLVEFRSRLSVLMEWALSYFTSPGSADRA